MVMTIDRRGHLLESGLTNIVPKERYVSQEFFDLEMERLWPRVWQMACREEEVRDVGDYLEYLIGDESILVVRSAPDTIKAYYNCCRHRGTRLATGTGNFATS
ncbi:MAG TPA: Rieske 2Fe-2S domain-containing protein, partial [Acidimicrobiia bacterium]|nr:Rieske 2Fe-2S domain-containing protein [Acidimicrobiia bacterium]